MPRPEELYHMLQRRPFEPFRLHLTDGRVFDIRFPKINVAGWDYFVIGIPIPNDPDPWAERTIHVPLEDIVAVEPLAGQTLSSSQ